jgi:transcriptional regulator with XRE-family HTH domain
VTDFSKFLAGIAAEFPSKKALADAIGMSQPRLSHALSGEGAYTFSVENCLRLAKVSNRSPIEVLRAAGKDDVAELLAFLFPKAGRPTVTGEQRQLLDDWDLLDEDERKAFRLLIRGRVAGRTRRAS